LHVVAESCTTCSSRCRWPVQKLLDMPLYIKFVVSELLPCVMQQLHTNVSEVHATSTWELEVYVVINTGLHEVLYNSLYKILHILNYLTHSTGQSHPWEADSCIACWEIPCLLQNPKVHYCVHKILLLDPVLSQMNPVHTLTTSIFSHVCYMLHPSHLPCILHIFSHIFILINKFWWAYEFFWGKSMSIQNGILNSICQDCSSFLYYYIPIYVTFSPIVMSSQAIFCKCLMWMKIQVIYNYTECYFNFLSTKHFNRVHWTPLLIHTNKSVITHAVSRFIQTVIPFQTMYNYQKSLNLANVTADSTFSKIF